MIKVYSLILIVDFQPPVLSKEITLNLLNKVFDTIQIYYTNLLNFDIELILEKDNSIIKTLEFA